MIIIERTYTVDRPEGGHETRITRRAFSDNDTEGVQAFLDERSTESGYPWHKISFNYTKL